VHVGIKTISGVVLALFIIVDIIITIINYDNGDIDRNILKKLRSLHTEITVTVVSH